jgi:hypothetical protein
LRRAAAAARSRGLVAARQIRTLCRLRCRHLLGDRVTVLPRQVQYASSILFLASPGVFSMTSGQNCLRRAIAAARGRELVAARQIRTLRRLRCRHLLGDTVTVLSRQVQYASSILVPASPGIFSVTSGQNCLLTRRFCARVAG